MSLEVESVGIENDGTKSIVFRVFSSKDSEKKERKITNSTGGDQALYQSTRRATRS